jgi:hypothetical protein
MSSFRWNFQWTAGLWKYKTTHNCSSHWRKIQVCLWMEVAMCSSILGLWKCSWRLCSLCRATSYTTQKRCQMFNSKCWWDTWVLTLASRTFRTDARMVSLLLLPLDIVTSESCRLTDIPVAVLNFTPCTSIVTLFAHYLTRFLFFIWK